MEHSYSRDTRPNEKTMATRTILVHKPPPCPSCHTTPAEQMDIDMSDSRPSSPPTTTNISKYNIQHAADSMEMIASVASKTKNRNSEDEDWELSVDKIGWTTYQHSMFAKVTEILSLDRLSRLTHANHPNEPVLRRVTIDKGAHRLRKLLATVHWDVKLVQWLHGLLIDNLPVSFVSAYLDILQTVRAKLPSLVDKMIQGRSNDLIESVQKPPWEPQLEKKDRLIRPEPLILLIPSAVTGNPYPEPTRWASLFGTLTPHVQKVELPETGLLNSQSQSPLADVLERLITLIRTRLHDLRKEHFGKPIILAGLTSTASAVALQVAYLEQNINSVICMGFSTNTMRGNRGHLDDRLVELITPVLFVVGQNAARTSQEQIEALREQMTAPTALVVVGSADDSLRVNHSKQRLEQVTQAMVDDLVINEVGEFISNCIANPPLPKKRKLTNLTQNPQPAKIVILDSPPQEKQAPFKGGVQALVRRINNKSPLKAGRVTKKKQLVENRSTTVLHKMSPPKKEYAESVTFTSPGVATSYEIVTGKIKQDLNMRQVVDGGFIQIASGDSGGGGAVMGGGTGAVQKYQLGTNPTVMLQKISLGNQFTPMRTTSSTTAVMPRDAYSVNAHGKRIYALQSADVTETIELDTDEEIINLDGDTVVDGNTIITTGDPLGQLTSADLSSIPVVFQDSDGNIQEPIAAPQLVETDAAGPAKVLSNILVTTQSVIPRPNKFIYYKPTTTKMTVAAAPTSTTAHYVTTQSYNVSGNGGANTGSSKPLIISVESLDNSTPSTVYHVVDDSDDKEE